MDTTHEPQFAATAPIQVALLAIAALLTINMSARAWGALNTHSAPAAIAARVLSVNDSAHLHVIHASGSTFIEEGKATGTLPGTVHASFTVGTSTVRSGFTIYLHGGSITGHGSAQLNAGRGEYASFGGLLTVNHGSGHYAHASGTGRLYGAINRYTDVATVQVIGRLQL